MQVLAKRLHARAWDHRNLSSPVTIEALISMRLNALVVDIAVVGRDGSVQLPPHVRELVPPGALLRVRIDGDSVISQEPLGDAGEPR